MIYRIQILIIFLYALFYFSVAFSENKVLGASDIRYENSLENELKGLEYLPQIETTTAFEQVEIEEYENIAYATEYVFDDELEYGKEEVVTPGILGVETNRYLVTKWIDEEIDRVFLSSATEPPVTEIVSKGTKIVWHELNTPEYGEIDYWHKMEVFATKYDSTCLGCNNTTALGAPVQKGVCAVDPTVIDMYTHFYVPGYGKCQALDVGGLIKGNRIDLAYENAQTGDWRTGYVEIYLMDNEPTPEDLLEE